MYDGFLNDAVPAPLVRHPAPGPNAYPALVLNADGRPLTYDPLPKMPWQESIRNVMLGHMSVVAEYDRIVRSPRLEMRIPAVVMSRFFVDRSLPAPLTRRNLFARDRYTCQYCGFHGKVSELSFEHVLPRAQGGGSTWENLVAACYTCNGKKGNRTPAQAGMKLMREPFHPTLDDMVKLSGGFVTERRIPKEWLDFVSAAPDVDAYWDVEIET